MLRRGFKTNRHIRPDTLSIHLYGRRMRKRLAGAEGGAPKRWSLIGKLLAKHGINPADAPLPAVSPSAVAAGPPPQPASRPPHPGPRANLTELADHYGSDKGSSKHRYTELYNLLFHPYRDAGIAFLEMGLQIGGPEHGASENRETTDLPSVRMWLDYFTRAKIFGLDVSDFSWFSADRFKFLRCDMDKQAEIDAAAAQLPELDIAIDDASHASAHQQAAFLTLFPKIRPGGLYIIEDLRWQPEVYEAKHPGITKTADLFQTWIRNRSFTHSDPEAEASFNSLSPQFSGCFLHQTRFDKRRKDQVLVVQKR